VQFELSGLPPRRNIVDVPISRKPLAMCDCASVNDDSDLFTVELMFKDRVGENQGIIARPQHKWCYFPQMEKSDALLFKTYDSDEASKSRFTMHTAFDDPLTCPHDPSRNSIEVRVVAIFPKQPETRTRRTSSADASCTDCAPLDHA
jgi:hypothetical protein